ncbi:hypothetical protein K8R03_04415 [Candidatus Kaiserbacteria bacterium]|nr:hypothetical protein [Candidatus Kaiserbacteria bacterium]
MDENQLNAQLAERFKSLPKVVRDAILSADVEKHMRALAETHNLHLDQWSSLENEVMLTLLGFQPTEELSQNLKQHVGLDDALAASLADDVSKTVFQPIRAELEKELKVPEQVPKNDSASEPAPQAPVPVAAAPVIAATPPRLPPETKAERAPAPAAYGTSVPSHERKEIEGDPYREQVK